ncbi:initiation factor 2 [Coniophora puteana RWD-64-598 SS2]|uniref:Translation initiation factor IF-2, mitochondrial n=1 Tax=Coniophora puteana (strain RWD-64-598) TaxID=741705 RepID=A0A5M3N2C8_CONPW|nr:initiation factor 2 [Coniophora puteana RWD-64-598 SS2]EIW85427.1 initiation factor 2 [Coniophora puteana RWD-64-598 SS2]
MENESSPSHVLTSEYAALLAEEFHRNPVINDEAAFDLYPKPAHLSPETLPARPPIVTIMGHVDHGKTTLLDTLRSASVAKGEAGGITQHIGAFSVPVAGSKDERTITFLDTPGHAAFSAMRARGASVTDIIVLVVAADDGIMPQTKEVINLIKQDEGKTQVVVAINKIDKPDADPESVHTALLVEGLQTEAMGGDIPSVEVSGLTGKGLDQLVETLSAIAEMQDIRAERDGDVQGYVLESKVQKGLGPVATVLVTRGALTTGSHLIAGTSWAKVRAMSDSTGAQLKGAYPGMAVTVSGWKELPSAGDEVLQGAEGEVKKAIANRVRKAEIEASLVDLEAINGARMQERMKKDEDGSEEAPVQKEEGEKKQLNLVIKGDVSGSVEALQGVLEEIGNDKVSVKVVSTGVGEVSDSDVQMAKATGGMIVAFSVKTPRPVENAAASAQVALYSTNIIYRAMEEVTNRVVGLLPTTTEFKVHSEATVLQVFDIGIKSKVTRKVAGCRITNGVVSKYTKARLLRKGEVLFTGSIDTLKQHKNDMTEIKKGSECAIGLENFGDIREGDTIETYEEIEVPGVL